MSSDPTHRITDLDTLQARYGTPAPNSLTKEVDYLHPHYRAFVEAAPFVVLATSGPQGLDASPRGDGPGFVVIEDDRTLLLPDRRGKQPHRQLLRNIVADPRVALLFLVPGVGETLRVNGQAEISVEPALLARFAVDGKPPRSVLRVRLETVFFQCSRAIVRSALWNPDARVDRASLPSAGQILGALSAGMLDGERYDRELPERVRATVY
ncbi:pyridoxamine 5'-phosphate oxidase family protein [Bordetella pertussis]